MPRPRKKPSLDDLRDILLGAIARARASGQTKTIADCVSELRQIALAELRTVPEAADRRLSIRQYTDDEIRAEFERRELGDTLHVTFDLPPEALAEMNPEPPKK